MTTTKQTSAKLGAGGVVFLIVVLLLAATSAFILFVPVDANNFETTTGVSWADFSSSNPEAAGYLTREARLLAIGFLGLSLLTAAVAWDAFRSRDRSLVRALCVFPLVLLGCGIFFVTADDAGLGLAYLVAAAIAAIGLALTRSRRQT